LAWPSSGRFLKWPLDFTECADKAKKKEKYDNVEQKIPNTHSYYDVGNVTFCCFMVTAVALIFVMIDLLGRRKYNHNYLKLSLFIIEMEWDKGLFNHSVNQITTTTT